MKLKQGQVWRVQRRYVQVVALLDATAQFKLLDSPNQRGERTLSSGADTLWRYLVSRKGQLVKAFSGPS